MAGGGQGLEDRGWRLGDLPRKGGTIELVLFPVHYTSETVQSRRSIPVGSLGLPELLVILFIVILIFGSNKLPQLGRGVGSAIKNFKEGMNDETPPKS